MTLRRLLNKRQNPGTQMFKAQPLSSTNEPMTQIDLSENSTSQEPILNSTVPTVSSNSLYQSQTHNTANKSLLLNSTSKMQEDDTDESVSEKIQKKVKTSTFTTGNLDNQRKLSCEEEKDGSEHSTACETHSDFNTAQENRDFPFSPPLTHCTSGDLPEMKLDANDDTPIKSGMIHIDLNSVGDASSRKSSDDLTQRITESFTSNKFLTNLLTRDKCHLNHQCEMEIGANLKKSCPRCTVLLEECKEFAKRNQGTCLNEEYEETIRYRCDRGHCWTLNYKNARRRWCAQCSKEERAFMKKKCEVDNIEREKQEEEFQKKLFEEAKKKATNNGPQQTPNVAGNNSESDSKKSMNTLEYLQKIDYELETLAKKYTVEFMSHKAFSGDMTYQQILQVYKIMIMPEEILQTYMFNLTAETLRPEFRRMAKIIHPDKNKHPNAGNAFQKIYKVYEAALSRLEGTQQNI